MSKFSIITAASRDLVVIQNLRKLFKEQTFQDFEHIIVYDGPMPIDVAEFIQEEVKNYNVVITNTETKEGCYGTNPRNVGIGLATGEFIIFADDDDHYHHDFIKSFNDLNPDNSNLCVVKMNDYGRRIPSVPPASFPQGCGDVGTPNCCYSREVLINNPNLRWQCSGYNHDFQFVRNYVDTIHPTIRYSPHMVVSARNVGRLTEYNMLNTPPLP